jgi:hypothetical protein
MQVSAIRWGGTESDRGLQGEKVSSRWEPDFIVECVCCVFLVFGREWEWEWEWECVGVRGSAWECVGMRGSAWGVINPIKSNPQLAPGFRLPAPG